ncbi:MAG: PAS domain-containing protein [Gammaproteobacteria bacterium]|nr:PAS domain-containing protein [Gammaproteobacteria bacterium]
MLNQQSINSYSTSQQGTPDAWYRLRLFNYFRSSLALFFITIFVNGWLFELIPSRFLYAELFIIISVVYFIASLFFITGMIRRKPGLDTQVIIHTLVDISCIIVLMHATGGIRTGLGMLLLISISMTSLFLPKRLTILFAAISTLAIISEQIYSQFVYTDYSPAFTQAGLLGILIFITATLSAYTAKRLKESEKAAEYASHELETIVQMNEHIIHNMRTGIIVIKNDGLILMTNNAALELLGKPSIPPRSNLQDVSADLFNRFTDWNTDTIQNHQPIQQTQGLPDIQPGFSHIDQSKSHNERQKGRTLIFLEDATQLTQRFQQVKLASLGRLTASIAHEIRNPLAAINHAGQLLGETSTDESDTKLTGIINTQVKRLNGIVENVLQLSRQQRGTPEAIKLHQWLLQFREECISTYKLDADQLQILIEPQDIEILFDSSQLHQVMWNLFTNAINHSHIDHSNIMIIIQGKVDEESGQPYIDIIDNGPGIDDETQTHIFDPFFTTSSEGTGLGLYITKEVIESNRAKIRHVPIPDGGTCFRIYFQQVP